MSGPGAAIYLIGGTTEAHAAVRSLAAKGFRVTVSVATPLGAARAAEATGSAAEAGTKDAAEMAARAWEIAARAIVDCSHPYAVAASAEARRAAASAGILYLRFSRAPLELPDEVLTAASWEEAAGMLSERSGRSLLTVGTRHLEPFVKAGLDFTARILPVPESVGHCLRLGIDPRHIIAAHPPFSIDFNRACIRRASAGVLVSKESGAEGGQAEKLEAVRGEGIDMLVVRSPAEPGAIYNLDDLIAALERVSSSCPGGCGG